MLKAEIGKESNDQIIYDLIGRKEFLTYPDIRKVFANICENGIVPIDTCLSLYISYLGSGPTTSLNATRIPVYLTHNPDGTSVKNLVHFGQLVISGIFFCVSFLFHKNTIG